LFDAMINEANASSSACRLWRIPQVETGAPPSIRHKHNRLIQSFGQAVELQNDIRELRE
jgi:hypothetical protein